MNNTLLAVISAAILFAVKYIRDLWLQNRALKLRDLKQEIHSEAKTTVEAKTSDDLAADFNKRYPSEGG